jgi:hypothetical protein
MTQVKAPWFVDQAKKLNEYQRCDWVHPFTCPNRDDGKHAFDTLIAGVDSRGWICAYCDYTQDWAHDFMFNGAPPHPFDVLKKGSDP